MTWFRSQTRYSRVFLLLEHGLGFVNVETSTLIWWGGIIYGFQNILLISRRSVRLQKTFRELLTETGVGRACTDTNAYK